MHVAVDLNSYLHFVLTAIVVVFSLLYLVKTTASKYFLVDDESNFDSAASPPTASFGDRRMEEPPTTTPEGCGVCGSITSKQCSRCKMVKYCSEACQRSHWESGHKFKCKDFRKGSSSAASLIPDHSKKVLFPYKEFLELFNWDSPGFPPCGLLNCGNSCFANVVLQCLTYTKPLVAYLLEKGHLRECRRNGWCFLCEFQHHVERASRSQQPFSPINILSRLPNIGGNLGYGKQEDAHEFMRFAIDTMQSVCLDEFGGEKAVPPNTQETTLIQHIFGGHLQSRVICTECNNVSDQFENMMDLTVEIHGDAESLEECLDQFTAREWLDGDNLYKCDGCNDYVKAWKCLMVRRAPNILTIALKRFQSGRFGKLNKRVTFPETLDLHRYVSEAGDGNNIYKLYAVIVHVDMLNASFFGHYICYIKDFRGSWYRIDDCKVVSVDLDEVLSQGAYMLLYSRIYPRPASLFPLELLKKEDQDTVKVEDKPGSTDQPVKCLSATVSPTTVVDSVSPPDVNGSEVKIIGAKVELSSLTNPEDRAEHQEVDTGASSHVQQEFLDVKPSSAATGISCLRVVSDSSFGATSSAEVEIQKRETKSPVSDSKDDTEPCQRTTNDCLLSSSFTEDSVATNGDMLDDASSSASSLGDISDNAKLQTSTQLPDKTNQNKEFSSHVSHPVVLKSGGGSSSGPKLKPLFAPGFLGKRPSNRCTKKDVSWEVCQNSTLNGLTNACAKPELACENDIDMDDQYTNMEDKYFESSNASIGQAAISLNETKMATCKSGESSHLENGDSAVPMECDWSTDVTISDEKS
ncbi:ubiquitin carboxyl-terminal hydrolase 18 [Nicotiana tabacum]|uniref:Ubiquitin carboxyl-terminal hydrolase 18 n=1 Tax=Nicotiana tabacum TaxID=4097 RepID=A0A1S4DND3_TOBAC|nr:PREDICTED: ubiquitin carboxyl-terminal hydrolase 19-like [Nicotiana tabacum]